MFRRHQNCFMVIDSAVKLPMLRRDDGMPSVLASGWPCVPRAVRAVSNPEVGKCQWTDY